MRFTVRVGIVLLGLVCLLSSQALDVHAAGGSAYDDGQSHYFQNVTALDISPDSALTRLENRPGNAFWILAPEANYWSRRVATDKNGATCWYNQVKYHGAFLIGTPSAADGLVVPRGKGHGLFHLHGGDKP